MAGDNPDDLQKKLAADQFLTQGFNEFLAMRQYQTAILSLRQAEELYREIGDQKGEADSLRRLSEVYSQGKRI